MIGKRISFIIISTLLCVNVTLNAQDLLPSDSYYKDNIAVNEVHAQAPSLKSPDEENGGPGGSEWGGGGWVGSPVGDAVLPILVAGIIYGSFLLLRRRRNAI